jgi:tetratricopeptide (TPR) repeat protein
LKAAPLTLDRAPELTLADLQDIKVPVDLLHVLPIEFCKKFKILPLRFETSSGILSFAFVDPDHGSELEKIRKKNGWSRMSAFKISDTAFQALIVECEKSLAQLEINPDNLPGWCIALIESDPQLRDSLQQLLQAQHYTVSIFANEDDFRDSVKKLSSQLKDEDDILALDESKKIVPFQAILVREATLKTPKTFCDFVWAHLNHLRITILEDRWLHRILEGSLTSQGNNNELDFHLRHDDHYHAAVQCLKQGNLFQAVELLERVTPDNAYYVKAKLILGKAFLKKKNFNKAAIHFQKAYDHWCEDPDGVVSDTILNLLYHLAYTFEKMSRLEDARKLYERVAGENPNFKEVGQQISRIIARQRKANADNEKKEGLPAFSKTARERSRYEKLDEIGRGGMGIVYRARDRVLGREVALKILNSHFKHDEKIVETFLREAKSLASLNHLHIVTVFDAGIEAGNYYISMEFIDGRTIRDLLKKKGHFRLSTTVALAKQVLKALSYAHSKRVIHRDITTNNMMLTETKIIKLMDFGLARVVNQLHSEQSIIGGTPYFMSPEQVEGAPIDHRTDIYSFGVCFYEMLTGQVPFPMENPGYHHLHTVAPNPRLLKPELPEIVSRIVERCLRKRPDDRFESADQILEELKQIPLSDPESSATISRVSRKP